MKILIKLYLSQKNLKKVNGLARDEIGKNLGMMDFDTASKISGSRFVILNLIWPTRESIM